MLLLAFAIPTATPSPPTTLPPPPPTLLEDLYNYVLGSGNDIVDNGRSVATQTLPGSDDPPSTLYNLLFGSHNRLVANGEEIELSKPLSEHVNDLFNNVFGSGNAIHG